MKLWLNELFFSLNELQYIRRTLRDGTKLVVFFKFLMMEDFYMWIHYIIVHFGINLKFSVVFLKKENKTRILI
jgi:hypothetical protein